MTVLLHPTNFKPSSYPEQTMYVLIPKTLGACKATTKTVSCEPCPIVTQAYGEVGRQANNATQGALSLQRSPCKVSVAPISQKKPSAHLTRAIKTGGKKKGKGGVREWKIDISEQRWVTRAVVMRSVNNSLPGRRTVARAATARMWRPPPFSIASAPPFGLSPKVSPCSVAVLFAGGNYSERC